MYIYAVLDNNNVVIRIEEFEEQIEANGYVQIESYDSSLIGKWYNPSTQTFQEPPAYVIAETSTDDICYKQEDRWLNDVLDGKAESDHIHSDYIDSQTLADLLEDKSDIIHNHDTDYASMDHTHSQYATITDMNTALSYKSDTDHTHNQYATTTDMNTALSGKSDTSHVHSDYVTASTLATALIGKSDTSHTHSNYVTSSTLTTSLNGKSDTSHTHSNYSPTTHTHTPASIGAATSSHTHSNYSPTTHTHTTLSNDLNVTGVIRCNGNQMLYTTSSMATIGTNNLSTVIASSDSTTINGSKLYTGNIYCRNTGGFDIGATSNRFKNIYLTNSPNVSSDKRLKEDIQASDKEKLANFIDNIEIVDYKYKDDPQERIGVIAQQLINIDEDVATYFVEKEGSEDGYLSVKPADLVFPLICAVQELKKEIEELKK